MIRTANLTGPVSRAAGGLYESVRRIVQELGKNEMEVTVLGTFDEFTREDISAWDPVTVRAFRPMGPAQFGYSQGYREFLELYRPHILHTHGIWIYSSVATHAYARRHRVPYMISPHGMLDPWALRNSRWKKRIASLFYEHAHLSDCTCLRALCLAEAEAFREYGLKNPIAVIPNGIDLPGKITFEGGGDRMQKVVKNLLFLGRIHPKKGIPSLLAAFSSVLREQSASTSWRLIIAGWDQGGHEADLKSLCSSLDLPWADGSTGHPESSSVTAPSVIFHGPAFGEEKRDLLRNADAFVLPSFSEGLPMAVLEAWAWSLPVLMTRQCNLPEGFSAGAALRIGTDPEEIAEGLRTLLSMKDEDLRVMGSAGQALVTSSFTWSHVAAQMSDVYRWMLGESPPPLCVMME